MLVGCSVCNMKEHEYNTLRDRRDDLISLSEKATLHKHKQMVEVELKNIREKLKRAHKKRYYETK